MEVAVRVESRSWMLTSVLLHPNSSARSSVHLSLGLPSGLVFSGFQSVVRSAQSASFCVASFVANFHFLLRALVIQSERPVLLLIVLDLTLSDRRIPSIALSILLWPLISFVADAFVSAQVSQP